MAEQADERSSSSDVNADARKEAARLMGMASTQAKAAAARENGKRGGRPKGIPMNAEGRRKISEAFRARSILRLSLPTDAPPETAP